MTHNCQYIFVVISLNILNQIVYNHFQRKSNINLLMDELEILNFNKEQTSNLDKPTSTIIITAPVLFKKNQKN